MSAPVEGPRVDGCSSYQATTSSVWPLRSAARIAAVRRQVRTRKQYMPVSSATAEAWLMADLADPPPLRPRPLPLPRPLPVLLPSAAAAMCQHGSVCCVFTGIVVPLERAQTAPCRMD